MLAISNHLSSEVQTVVSLAKECARQYGLNYVGTEHLVLGIICEPDSIGSKVLNDLGVDEDRAKECIDEWVKMRSQETWVMGRLPGTPHFRDVLTRASVQCKGTGNWQIRSEHLLAAILEEKNCTGYKALVSMGVTPEAFRKAMLRYR